MARTGAGLLRRRRVVSIDSPGQARCRVLLAGLCRDSVEVDARTFDVGRGFTIKHARRRLLPHAGRTP